MVALPLVVHILLVLEAAAPAELEAAAYRNRQCSEGTVGYPRASPLHWQLVRLGLQVAYSAVGSLAVVDRSWAVVVAEWGSLGGKWAGAVAFAVLDTAWPVVVLGTAWPVVVIGNVVVDIVVVVAGRPVAAGVGRRAKGQFDSYRMRQQMGRKHR